MMAGNIILLEPQESKKKKCELTLAKKKFYFMAISLNPIQQLCK